MRPSEKIEKLFTQTNIETNSDADKAVIDDAVKAMSASKQKTQADNKPSVGRIIMNNKITKFAVAAVLTIAALIGINQFGGSIDGSSVAFAQVLRNIQKSGYSFNLVVEPIGQMDNKNLVAIDAKAIVIQSQKKVRLNWYDDQSGEVSSIVDYNVKKGIQLFHKSKLGRIFNYDGNISSDFSSFYYQPIEQFWGLKDGSEEYLGEKDIDGHAVTGFKVIQSDFEIIIWADSKSELPYYVEAISTPNEFSISTKWTMGGFVFGVEPDQKVFSIDGPVEYRIVDHSGKVIRNGLVSHEERPINQTKISTKIASDYMVKPGEGIGDVKFAMTREQVVKILGQPDQFIGKQCLDYTATHGISFLVSSKRGLVAIDCWSRQENTDEGFVGGKDFAGKTEKGIGINSTREDVIAVYGKPQREYLHKNPDIFELYYPNLHTIFRLQNDRVIHLSMNMLR